MVSSPQHRSTQHAFCHQIFNNDLRIKRSSPLRKTRICTIAFASLIALSGCGSQIQEGDEAWILVPGESILYDEFAVVEVINFSGDRVRVELLETMPVVSEFDGILGSREDNRGRLYERLKSGRSVLVSEDDLLGAIEGEQHMEDRQEFSNLIFDFLKDSEDFLESAEGDTEELNQALDLAERHDAEEAILSVQILTSLVEATPAIGTNPEEPQEAFVALKESTEGLMEILNDHPNVYSRTLQVLGASSSSRRRDTRRIDASEVMAVVAIKTLSEQFDRNYQSFFEADQSVGQSPEDLLRTSELALATSDTLSRLLTKDGEKRYSGERLKDLMSSKRSEIQTDLQELLLNRLDFDEITSKADADASFAEAEQAAQSFQEELGIAPIDDNARIRLYEAVSNNFSQQILEHLRNREIEESLAAVKDYLDLNEDLASLYSRHQKGELAGPDRAAHLAEVKSDLADRIAPSLVMTLGQMFDPEALDSSSLEEKVAEMQAWIAPYESALDATIVDEKFFREFRENVNLNSQRKAVQVGQTWTGWINCGEATAYKQYKAGSNSRGAYYHGPERLNIELKLLEVSSNDTRMIFQGMLTAQNFSERSNWRYRETSSGTWKNNSKLASSQFVVLTYHPRLLTVSLEYGVLNRSNHVETFGESRYYVGNTDGTWWQFHGRGTLGQSHRQIEGKLSKRYVDDTCSAFSLRLSNDTAPVTASEAVFALTPVASEPESSDTSIEGSLSSPPARLSQETYIGGMKARGMQVYALSENGDWCDQNVFFKIKAQSKEVFDDGTAEYYLKTFGEKIGEPQFCPSAETAQVFGYVGEINQPVVNATASAIGGWRME